ncbi:uncharacterized protein CIMG_05974 [Coccidioides immitis RS]|uniref:Integral membrane protein n=3 Tax=Coccidioides immitis TaxID=5501 RepID=J3K759_COCIM|nr:uncharacterized protein CIMG_05974 [Coccidioides immitis RS]EAS30495.3 integral membrane protein [Coccidioides immitis RS]KMP03037.1 YTP1 protein [Coccidioides immitis RMSCC 2394]TPX23438.1 hypothetical protein DIZ76_012770 [Coccidioides immitis]
MKKMGGLGASAALVVLSLAATVHGHDHHDSLPEGQVISAEPLDSILWTHILLMVLAFGVIFPTGMVLGLVRSRWHVPVQIVGAVVAFLAYFLGHLHKGRQFSTNIHAAFASSLMLMLIIQLVLGAYLKLHLSKGIHAKFRCYVVTLHGLMGKMMPLVSWIQMLFGGITALGFCHDDHLGQCLAHFIMGSAFIAYAIILTILLLVGQVWLRRTGRSQEFFDSLVITLWGCINTFTEHRWGQPWRHNDMQHTSMGIIWWCAGLLGLWLSRRRNGRPRRNIFPAIVILLTGYAMSSHPQHLPLSAMVHSVFGYTLMAAGAARIVEICFVLKDRSAVSDDGTEASSFQYLTPFLLYASGFLFMGATEEQMELLSNAGIDHVSYILVLYSVACIMFLFINILLHIYGVHAFPETAKYNRGARMARNGSRQRPPQYRSSTSFALERFQLESPQVNGLIRTPSQTEQIRDAQEFELEGLIGAADKDRDEEDSPVTPTPPPVPPKPEV